MGFIAAALKSYHESFRYDCSFPSHFQVVLSFFAAMILGGGQTAGEAGIVKLKTHLAGSQATDVSVAPSNGATSKEMDEMGAPKGRTQNL